MWLCTNNGFFSIARVDGRYSGNAENEIYNVRSRDESHLKITFPDKKVHEYLQSDYQFRVYLTQEELNLFLLDEASRVTYSNFKNSVVDVLLHKFYNNIWWLGVSTFRKTGF